MPKPELYPIKRVGVHEGMMVTVENWRAKQKPIPNVTDAVRRGVDLGIRDDERRSAHGLLHHGKRNTSQRGRWMTTRS
jgi:hypothetical protein